MPARCLIALLAAFLATQVAACDAPPKDAYVTTSITAISDNARKIGADTLGEQCLALPGQVPTLDLPASGERDIFCGGWRQPAARVVTLRGPDDAAALDAIATGGLWRSWLDQRFLGRN
jgi:hypothetical protein